MQLFLNQIKTSSAFCSSDSNNCSKLSLYAYQLVSSAKLQISIFVLYLIYIRVRKSSFISRILESSARCSTMFLFAVSFQTGALELYTLLLEEFLENGRTFYDRQIVLLNIVLLKSFWTQNAQAVHQRDLGNVRQAKQIHSGIRQMVSKIQKI